jgi:hypothetical protein
LRTISRTGKRAFAGALVVGAIGMLVAPHVAQAHFVLNEPPAWMSQDSLGIPEKLGPCGDESDGTDAATPSNIVTAYQQGQTITVTVNEVIFHPGHYRISLAVNDRSELPAEPLVTAGSTACGSAPIQSPPVFPVLADGVFVHTTAFTAPQSIQITLPANVTCTKCTLQVIEFMADHGLNVPGGCFYHHCADLSIQPPDGGGTSVGTDAATGVGRSDASSSSPPGTDAGGGTVGSDGGGTGGTTTGAGASADAATDTAKGSSSSGCSLGRGHAASTLEWMGGLGAAVMMARRRRRRARPT